MIDSETQDRFINSLPQLADLEDMVKMIVAIVLAYDVDTDDFKLMILELGKIVASGDYDEYSKMQKKEMH
jgi:hypothetical protein